MWKYRLLETAQEDGGASGGGESPPPEANPEIERQAREMGWSPKENWKGRPESWVDAQEFVRRGETFIPFLQGERKRLRTELDGIRSQFSGVQTELQQTRQQLQALTEFNQQMAKDRDDRRKAELGTAIRSEEDPVRKAEMETELRTITDRDRTRSAPPERQQQQPPPQQQPPAIQPWVQNFLGSNREFFENPHKIALFNSVVSQKRQQGDARVGETDGTAFLNEAREEVERMLGGNQRRQAPPRTEDSRPGGGGSRSGGKGYFDMPADAQGACDSQEKKFVGEGKAFKTQAEWRKHFATEYFG